MSPPLLGLNLQITRKMAAALDESKHRKRTMALLVQTFYSWRQFTISSRQRKMRLQRAMHWYIEVGGAATRWLRVSTRSLN